MTALLPLEGYVRVGKEIGRGGFGVVYRGEVVADGAAVAVKVLEPGMAADNDRLHREAELLSALDHPRLVKFFGLFATAEGRRALVYDLVEGRTLTDVGADGGELPIGDWLAQMGEALDVLHAAGLVHRDMKPDNVMVQPDGTLRLLDYGLLRAAAPGGTLTQEGVLLGTPLFMAPELLRGERATPASDLYALACVGYWMLEREHAFPTPDPAQSLSAKQAGAPPSRAAAFFRRALHPDPGQRYPSGKAMAQGFLAPVMPEAATLVLEDAKARLEVPSAGARPAAPSTTRRLASWGRPLAIAGAGLLLSTAAAWFFLAPLRPPAPPGPPGPALEEVSVEADLDLGRAILRKLEALERRFFPAWAPVDVSPLEAAMESRVMEELSSPEWRTEWRRLFDRFLNWVGDLPVTDRGLPTGEVLRRGAVVLGRMAGALQRYGNPVVSFLPGNSFQDQVARQNQGRAIERTRAGLLQEVESRLGGRAGRSKRWLAVDLSLLRLLHDLGVPRVGRRFSHFLVENPGVVNADDETLEAFLYLTLQFQGGFGEAELRAHQELLAKVTPERPSVQFQAAVAKICGGVLLERLSGQALDRSAESATIMRLLKSEERRSTWPGQIHHGMVATLARLRRQHPALEVRLRRLTGPVIELARRVWPRLSRDPEAPDWRQLPARLRWDLFRCQAWRYQPQRRQVTSSFSLDATTPFLEGMPKSWGRIEAALPATLLLNEWAMAGGDPRAVPAPLAAELREVDAAFVEVGLFRPSFPFAYLAGFEAEVARPSFASADLPARATGVLGYAYGAVAEAERTQGRVQGEAVLGATLTLVKEARQRGPLAEALLELATATIERYGNEAATELLNRSQKLLFTPNPGQEPREFIQFYRQLGQWRSARRKTSASPGPPSQRTGSR